MKTKAYGAGVSLLLLGTVVAAGTCAKISDPAGAGSGGSSGMQTGTGGGGRSGTGGAQGRGGQGGLLMARDGGPQCGLESFDLIRKPAVVMLVLDRSESMIDNLMDETPTGPNDPTKWSQLIPALTMTIPRIGGDISWGMKTFPEGGTPGDGPACTPQSVTTAIDLPVAPMNAAALVQAINGVGPYGDGTPTGVAVTVATDYLKMLPNDSRKYILLATDGQPSCYGTLGALVEEDGSKPNSRGAAVSAVAAAAGAGIHTFVVGLVIKPNDTTTLNDLAMAGLEARDDPNPIAMKFYQASTQNELTRALEAITGVVSTCVFPLSKPPPVPENIAVKVSGTKAPQDTSRTNGWDYTNPSLTEVEVFGSWCDMIKTTAANKVEIIFGCPDIEIP